MLDLHKNLANYWCTQTPSSFICYQMINFKLNLIFKHSFLMYVIILYKTWFIHYEKFVGLCFKLHLLFNFSKLHSSSPIQRLNVWSYKVVKWNIKRKLEETERRSREKSGKSEGNLSPTSVQQQKSNNELPVFKSFWRYSLDTS